MTSMIMLSGENIELAIGELEGVMEATGSDAGIMERDGRMIFLNKPLPEGSIQRTGFAHFLSKDIISSNDMAEDAIEPIIDEVMDSCDRNGSVSVKIISPDGKGFLSRSSLFNRFCRRATDSGFILHHRDPDQRIFISAGKRIHAGIIDEEVDRVTIRERKGSKMPFNRPIVMEPKLARVMVNLSGLPPGSIILDPFMGPAGLAIEAAHLGYRVIGIERDPDIFKGALENIRTQGLGDMIDANLGDSRNMDEMDLWEEIDTIDGIITDPPFGRAAPLMGERPGSLLKDVIDAAYPMIREGGVLVMDTNDRINFSNMDGFETDTIYDHRVHKSLTRYFGRMIRK